MSACLGWRDLQLPAAAVPLAAHGLPCRAAGSVPGPAAGGPAEVAGGRSYWLDDETINLGSDDTNTLTLCD